MEEYGERYIDAAIQFCELVRVKNNGVFPVDLMTLSDNVICDVVFDAILRKDNYDLLVFTFLKFSKFEYFFKYNAFFTKIFCSDNPCDNCFFLFSLLKHMNFVLCDVPIDTDTLCTPFGEQIVLERMSKENRQSLLFILDNNFDYVFDSSILYINKMENKEKEEIINYFEFLIFQNGFDNLLFLMFLGAKSFYELGRNVDYMFNKLPKNSGYRKIKQDNNSC